MDKSSAAGLRLITADSLSAATAQTGGMLRSAAISGDLVGARGLWMGRTVVLPGTSSGDHHHGVSETGIYVVSGNPVFVFRDPDSGSLVRLETSPGDYMWVPPRVPYREENPFPRYRGRRGDRPVDPGSDRRQRALALNAPAEPA
jgi:uncharacterized RmlC-like cupin family protein